MERLKHPKKDIHRAISSMNFIRGREEKRYVLGPVGPKAGVLEDVTALEGLRERTMLEFFFDDFYLIILTLI